MPARVPSKWQPLRSFLRRARLCLLLLALLLLAAVIYLNEVGLPDFLKQPLVRELRARGMELQFSRLRWRWYRGLVAEDVHFGVAQSDANSPRLSIREVALKLNHAALARFGFKVDAVSLRGGQLIWPVSETNQPPESLSVTNIQTQLRFLPEDQWELDNFTAAFGGAKVRLSGSLTNASALRDWKIFHGHAEAQPELLRQRLRELARAVDRIKFSQPPELNVIVRGDARDSNSFNGLFTLETPDATTPWGNLTNGVLVARLIAPGLTNSPLYQAEIKLSADEVGTRWGSTRHFHLNLHATRDELVTDRVNARLEMSAARFNTPWAQATNAQFTAHWTHSLTNPIPIDGTVELRLTEARTRWASAGELRLEASLSPPPTNGPPPADSSWGWWAGLAPYFLDWSCRLENVHAKDFKSQTVLCAGNWHAPELTITNLHTEMYQGRLDANATLDVATRLASFACQSDFDVQKAIPFLTPGGREWFEAQEFAWEKPPLVHASGSLILPAWTNRQPDWRAEVLPTLLLRGDFKVGAAAFHKLPVSSAQSHVTYSNEVWNLPDLLATRPEGKVELAFLAEDRSKGYYFRIHSTADIKILRALLEQPAAQRGLDTFVYAQPPEIAAEIWGRWHDYERIGAKGTVALGNFTFRGESATSFRGDLAYTNHFLVLTNARLERTNQLLTAASVGFDITGKKAYLTNGYSTMEPLPVLHVIGPKVTRDLEPYHFLQPPTVYANGVIPLSDDIRVADLHFKVDGGPFEWLKFRVPHISGVVNWAGESMTLNDVQASFYGGKLSATAAFDFRRKVGTDFSFDTIVTDAKLQALMADLTPGTNHLEGILSGNLKVTQANTPDPKSWFGKGRADLREGLVTEIPIFGILSPILDGLSPGLGQTRLSDASGTFIITNSVIRSDDLELRSPSVRLLYRGTVDFDMQVDATVEAEVGRDMPLAGPLLSTFLAPFGKLFETRLTGTLSNPKREPVYFVPKLLSPFIHPWRTLKDLIPGDSGTVAPPIWPVEKTPQSPTPPSALP